MPGVGCEPASAAAVAGIRQLTAIGKIPAEARVVAVLTGHMLKDPEILLAAAGDAAIAEIDATPEALAHAVERTPSQ